METQLVYLNCSWLLSDFLLFTFDFKVNWTAKVYAEDLIRGKLPDIQVPTQVKEERFYQVSYQDQSVSISFTIV